MKKLWLALFLALGLAPAQAQQTSWPPPAGAVAFLCVYNAAPASITTANPAFAQCDVAGGLRAAVASAMNVTPTDCSGTITLGGTAQNAFAASPTRRGFTITNLSTDPMWISFTGMAAVGAIASYLLAAGSATVMGGNFTSPLGFGVNTALSVIAATTTDKFSCTTW